MSIMQDKKGFMWFATWDGLCRFDGYNFTTYKTSPEDSIFMTSNRIDKIIEDFAGNIWVHAYNKETFCFDPIKEKYIASFHIKQKPFITSEIIPMPSGKVWLTSKNTGAVCSMAGMNTYKIYSQENGNLTSNNVRYVYEDKDQYSWILTDNGINRLNKVTDENETFFFSEDKEVKKISFFTAYETETEVWFGTNEGRIIYFNKKNERFGTFETGIKSDIISIKNVYDNLLIVLTSDDGFLICDKNRTTLNIFDKTILKELPTNKMKSCFIDSNNNVWLEMDVPGVAKFNLINNQLRYYRPGVSVKSDLLFPPLFDIVEDKNGRIWVHPRGGGFSYYDKTSDRLLPFFNDPSSSEWKFSHMLHDLFMDRQGNMWISTRTDGIEKITFDDEVFKISDFGYKSSAFNFEVRAIFEDNKNNIWIGSKEGTISVYDQKKDFKGYLSVNGNISKTDTPLKAMTYTFIQDSKNNIWIGSKGNGLYLLEMVEGKQDSYNMKHYIHESSDMYSLSNNSVYSIHEDNTGHIWIGTFGGGINLFDKSKNQFINCNNILNKYPSEMGYQVRTVNSRGSIIYVGTTLGLVVFSADYNNLESTGFKIYTKSSNTKDGLRANDIYNLFITRQNNIYLTTRGGGISQVSDFDPSGFPVKFKTYDTSNHLPFDIVLSVIEDKDNKLWVIGEGNLVRFDPQNNYFEQFRDVARILENNFFSESGPLSTTNGELILGCTKGTISFMPENIRKDEYHPYIAFIKFKISGEDYILKGELDDTEKIILKHNQNTLSLEYAALDFANPQSISYAYKLDGLDDDWIYGQNQRLVNYTNLAPGEYVFKVKSTNSNGIWTSNERNIIINIKPSFWQTQWAYLIYIITFILVLFFILRSIFVFYRMRDKVRLEQEQTEMKTRFYTDISHEIRTPLTMIVSPIEDIIENNKVLPDAKPQLKLVLKNANRMLNMVNQILDFRKIQKKSLQVREVSFGEFFSDLCNNFTAITESKGISLVINKQVHAEKVWVDTESIEKLIFNLVSNAIKYTTPGKKIEINIFRKDKNFILQVKDEGKGMTKEIQNKLFTRFASFNTDKSKPSTGIGLSIVKEIADKHHAKVTVDSEVNKGSVFTVSFPSGLEHFSDDENIEIINTDLNIASGLSQREATDAINKEEDDNSLSILIVEDDIDLRSFIKSVLHSHYRVYEAANGKEGYETILKFMPDFVLSDIMMPEMDGMELLQKVRSNNDTSHIPFILLTAKTNIDDKIEGTISGADDYITKPFNVKLLKAKIENIIKQRKSFSRYLTNNGIKDDSIGANIENKSHISASDEQFLKDITSSIDKNIDNSELTIDHIVSETNLSRKVFYNKVKGLTGMAPVEFVRDVRIRRAAQLIKTGEYMVKEVTYMVGFSDIKYFSRCFKHVYGKTPSEYRDQSGN